MAGFFIDPEGSFPALFASTGSSKKSQVFFLDNKRLWIYIHPIKAWKMA
jgi:hypothetical protein